MKISVSAENVCQNTEKPNDGLDSVGHIADVHTASPKKIQTESVTSQTSLRSNIQWSLIGNVFYAGCQWAILILMAKLSNPESVGQFTLGLALTAPIFLFANLQLSAILATDANRSYGFGHYLALRLITTLLSTLAIAVLVLAGHYETETTIIISAVCVAKAFEAISDIYLGVLQQHHRFERVAWSLILKGGVSLIAVVIGFFLTGTIIGAAIGLAATNFILMLTYDLRSIAWLRKLDTLTETESEIPQWEWSKLSGLAWMAFPFGVRVMLLALCANIPRYFIEMNDDFQALGIFAALAYVSVVVQVISNAISQAASPQLGNYYATGNIVAFRWLVFKVAIGLTAVGGAGIVAAVLFGSPMLKLLYSQAYAEHSTIFTWIMVSSGIWCISTIFAVAANAGRRQGSQVLAGIIVTIATLIASAILIPRDSLHGAAITSVISAIVGFITFGGLFLMIGRGSSAEKEGYQRDPKGQRS
jgi:O-antigen/teichoic acid export membrane protein